jgi:hypothetical protein
VVISTVGKNSHIPPEFIVEPGAVISTDVIESDYSSNHIRGNEHIETRRPAYEF